MCSMFGMLLGPENMMGSPPLDSPQSKPLDLLIFGSKSGEAWFFMTPVRTKNGMGQNWVPQVSDVEYQKRTYPLVI